MGAQIEMAFAGQQRSCTHPATGSRVAAHPKEKPPRAAKRRGCGEVVLQSTPGHEHNTAIAPAKGLTASVAIPRVAAWLLNQCLGVNDNWARVGLLPGERR
jgi:hypothetical protein